MPDTNQAAEVVSAIKRQPKQTAPTSSDGETPRTTETTRQDAHFTLQAKGGIGKSFVAWVLAQWHMERGLPVASFDTDPGNATFEAFEAFKVQHVSILDDDQINVDGMDGLIEGIIAAHSASVVDNGAASFLPMARYLMSNNIAAVLAEHRRRLVVHTVVVGGQSALDTLGGMVGLLTQFPAEIPIVVWVNQYAGLYDADGLTFIETKAYRDHKDRIAAVVYLPHEDARTHGRDVAAMLSRHLTFAEAIASPDFKIVAKARLAEVKRRIFDQLDKILPAL